MINVFYKLSVALNFLIKRSSNALSSDKNVKVQYQNSFDILYSEKSGMQFNFVVADFEYPSLRSLHLQLYQINHP